MKWTGWSWNQLMECPKSVYDEIVKVINEEAEEAEIRRAGM